MIPTVAAVATIVLVHGLWLTPRSWEHWITHYERQGHQVLAPAYPGLEPEVEALRADPSPIAALTPGATLAHLRGIVARLEQPVVIGHSFGGVLARGLADLCAAGVALHALPGASAGTPSSMPLTLAQFRYALANTFHRRESARLFERYAIPAPTAWAWDARPAGLLELTGDEDNLVPPGTRVVRGRCHLTLLQDGWEQLADDVLAWALAR
jgi:pimeloyl-ACP methyl ester carboxylesterase